MAASTNRSVPFFSMRAEPRIGLRSLFSGENGAHDQIDKTLDGQLFDAVAPASDQLLTQVAIGYDA
jgi:hypothetical protein